jgi:hypothetical protein
MYVLLAGICMKYALLKFMDIWLAEICTAYYAFAGIYGHMAEFV